MDRVKRYSSQDLGIGTQRVYTHKKYIMFYTHFCGINLILNQMELQQLEYTCFHNFIIKL